MRYLNKIIFINSAAIKYAEIDLEGNVHFIGNQGAGKTALLRAILFFYNANKTKLGIGREKKRFDDYYFEYQNSYIIYEVKSDYRNFCVLAYKVNGKTAFRFIDAPYNRDFFIDTDGKAYESWDKIRMMLGKGVHYTKLVTNYEEYRKIIYGDNKDLKPEFRKYAIIESKQYQNIPRTIQNVFLNAKLEANFIKNTIIKSISDEVYEIDLENYSKNHLKDFETQINDIRLWTEKNKNGQIIIRRQADRIIEKYRQINYIKKEKSEAIKQLKCRLDYIDAEKYKYQRERDTEYESLENIKKDIEKVSFLQQKKEIELTADIKSFNDKLKEAKEKQQYYQSLNINEIIKKVDKKYNLNQQKNALIEEKNLLESQFSEINQKYQALIDQVKNLKDTFKNQKTSEINELKDKFTNNKIEISEKYSQLINHLKEQIAGLIEEKRQKIQALKDDEHKLKQQKIEIKHKKYFQKEITKLEQQKAILSNDIKQQGQEIKNSKNMLKTTKREWELEEKNIIRDYKQKTEKEQDKITRYQKEIELINKKISQSKHSFYAWLNENYAGWQDTIGKVIDENVLYKNELSPTLISQNNKTLFGIGIDLSKLERNVKTVAELNKEIKEFEQKIIETRKIINLLNGEKDAELENLKQKFRKKINKLNDSISLNEYNIPINQKKLKETELELDEWKEKAEVERNKDLQKLEYQLEKMANEIDRLSKEVDNGKEIEKRKINKFHKEKENEISQLQNELKEKQQIIKKEIADKLSEFDKRINDLQHQKNNELNNNGADTDRLEKINLQLQTIINKLDFIEKNNTLVIEYNKDKRELFDKIPDFENEMSKLENKLNQVKQEYSERKQKLEEKEVKQKKTVDDLDKVLMEFKNDIDNFEKFKKSEIFKSIETEYITANKLENTQTATEIIENIKDKYFQLIKHFDELKRNINNFTDKFTENNIFNFKVNLKDDDEYLNFAIDLKEFVEEDKIKEYEKRVNERFAHIVQLIGRETTELISKEAEIEKIIKKINADFVSKNFVKAIKEMEIRLRKSANPVVNILSQIKEFNDENGMSIGINNLFTTNESSQKNQRAVMLLKQLVKKLDEYKYNTLSLSDSFDLEFRIVENDNDSGWVEKLSNVGSEGTDVLIKAIVNILLLNVFKENVSKKFKDFRLHCMMDEIGKLHPINVKGILRFANERNILLINSSPTSQNAMDYKYTYKLTKEMSKTSKKHFTKVTRLVKVN